MRFRSARPRRPRRRRWGGIGTGRDYSFTTQTQADWLSPKLLATWLGSVGYSGRTDPTILHTQLLAAPRGTTGPDAEIHAAITKAYVALLRVLNTQIAALEDDLAKHLTTHPDTHIYASVSACLVANGVGEGSGDHPCLALRARVDKPAGLMGVYRAAA